VGDAISRVQDDTGGAARSVEGQNGLNGDVKGGRVESLEPVSSIQSETSKKKERNPSLHDLGHLLAVDLGVQRRFSEKDGVFFRGDSKLVVEGVVPDLSRQMSA
jgi:hypothetical protein